MQQKSLFSLSYRKVQKNDFPFLVPLMEQLGHPISSALMRENIEIYLNQPNHYAWVAVKDDEIVGCLALALTYYFHRQGTFARIITLVTDERFRGHGIGKQLIEIAENFAGEQNCCHIELTSGIRRKEAHLFYHAQNYTELNEIKKYFAKKIASNRI